MADVLPGFGFDNGRYRDAQTGRFVSRSSINNLLRTEVQSAENRYHELATALHEGRISPASWVEQMRTEQRRLTLQQQALAKGGFAQLDNRDFGKAGASLRQQYAKIVGTAQDVAEGKISLPQLLNRVDGYVGESRRLYHDTLRENMPNAPDGMTTIERRRLDPGAMSCSDCIDYYDRGWQPAGVLPGPGTQCRCGSHCRCDIISQDVPTAELDQWIGTRR